MHTVGSFSSMSGTIESNSKKANCLKDKEEEKEAKPQVNDCQPELVGSKQTKSFVNPSAMPVRTYRPGFVG
jgi:hypothetical protein